MTNTEINTLINRNLQEMLIEQTHLLAQKCIADAERLGDQRVIDKVRGNGERAFS